MVATSSKTLDRFTPETAKGDPNPPVYLISIPTPIGRAQFHRTMTSLGARYWQRDGLIELARVSIQDTAPDNADSLLTVLEEFQRSTPEPDLSDEELAALTDQEKKDRDSRVERLLSLARGWVELVGVLQRSDPAFAQAIADNQFWVEVAPLIAASHFLVDAENSAAKVKRGKDGIVPESQLTELPEGHAVAIGGRALSLMTVTESERKNSKSPQPSPSTRADTTAASSPPMAAPGTSSELSIVETQD